MVTSYTMQGDVDFDGWPISYNTAGVTVNCDLPDITVTRLDETHLQIDFADPVLVIPTLFYPGAYLVTPVDPNPDNLRNLTPVSVELGNSTPDDPYDSTTQVILTTDEQGPTDYDVTVFGLEEAG